MYYDIYLLASFSHSVSNDSSYHFFILLILFWIKIGIHLHLYNMPDLHCKNCIWCGSAMLEREVDSEEPHIRSVNRTSEVWAFWKHMNFLSRQSLDKFLW